MTDYVWTPAGTDITARWRRMGWTPPSELPAYQQKWSSYRELPLRNIDNNSAAAHRLLADNVINLSGART